MNDAQIKEIGKKYAFDFQKLNGDMVNGKVNEDNAARIWSLYDMFLTQINNQHYDACYGIFNTLELSGYYVDYTTLKRKETIDGIITSEDQPA